MEFDLFKFLELVWLKIAIDVNKMRIETIAGRPMLLTSWNDPT